MPAASSGTIHRDRLAFEQAVRTELAKLSPESRAALATCSRLLRGLAQANAAECQRRNKWMLLAYWKVLSVTVGHYIRLARDPVTRIPKSARVDRPPLALDP